MKVFPILYCAALCVVPYFSWAQDKAAATAERAIPTPNTPDGFTVLNGRVYFVRNGQMSPLDQEVVLRVSPAGTITAFDGKTYAIPNGQVLTLAAGVAALPQASQAAASALSTSGTGAAETNAAGASASNSRNANSPAYVTGGSTGFDGSGFPIFIIPGSAPGATPITGSNTGIQNQAVTSNGSGPIPATPAVQANPAIPANPPTSAFPAGSAPLTPAAVANQQNSGTQQANPQSNTPAANQNATGSNTGTQQTNPQLTPPMPNPSPFTRFQQQNAGAGQSTPQLNSPAGNQNGTATAGSTANPGSATATAPTATGRGAGSRGGTNGGAGAAGGATGGGGGAGGAGSAGAGGAGGGGGR